MKVCYMFRKVVPLLLLPVAMVSYNKSAYAVPIQLHNDLATNINANRYLIDEQWTDISGQANSPWIVTAAAVVGAGAAVCALSGTCRNDVDRLYRSVRNYFFDPQDVILFSSLKVDSVEYLDNLISTSLLPEYTLEQFSLPDLFGGSIYTATDAFSGYAIDENDNVITGVAVGYGVLSTNEGNDYFVATSFGETLPDLLNVSDVEYDLSAVIPSGNVTATRRGLRVFDDQDSLNIYVDAISSLDNPASVPEPSTMLLFCSGMAGLIGIRIRREK